MAVTITTILKDLTDRLPRDIGNTALAKAQATVPIQTGELFRSLSVDIQTTQVTLSATAPYANEVENGANPVLLVTGKYVQKVKRFRRKSKNGVKHVVRGHTKTFTNQKPVLLDPTNPNPSTQQWRTRSVSSGRQGTFFMKNAVEEAIAETIEKTLLRLGAKKGRS